MCSPCYQSWYQKNKRPPRQRKDPSEYAENYRKFVRAPPRIPDCHPDKPHAAHGLCDGCYQKENSLKPRATCHPSRGHVANGLCRSCLSKDQYWGDPETARKTARESGMRVRARLRTEMLEAYGNKCACPKCPETNPDFLCLDHINGDGKFHRLKVGSHTYTDLRKRGWPQGGYRLLCWNCNSGTRWGRPCPHEKD